MTETQSRSDPRPSFGGEVSRNLPAHNWGWFLFRGIIALILGLLAIFFPFSALTAFAFLFALFAFVDGVSLLVTGIAGATHHRERWWGLLIAGLAGIAVGVIYMAWPGLSTVSYAFVFLVMIAIWAIVNGLGQIGAAIRLRREIEGEWLLAVAGFFSVLLGVAILVVTAAVPGASLLSVGLIIGFYALLAAVVLIGLAIRLRGHKRRNISA
ncbi:MAG TPA: DUF308 domain-containing protein [Sphingomicrobium sp.]|jgi:uncharacterized membrane protein HdeD (DUF308 family)|nr:DUF308 domain-containing protein [Sphingomicrobium sp.]